MSDIRVASAGMLVCCWLAVHALGQAPPADANAAQTTTRPATAAAQSDAERIARLTRTIEENDKLVAELKAKLDDPEAEYVKAEADFKQLDAEFEAKAKEQQKLQEAGRTDEASALQTELEGLGKRRALARERFDLAIQERRTLQEQLATTEQKLVQDRQALQALVAPPVVATQPIVPAEAPGEANAPPAAKGGAGDSSGAPPAAAADAPSPPPAGVSVPVPVLPAAPAEKSAPKAAPAAPPSKELVQAQEQAQAKEAEAAKAEREVRSVAERIEALVKSIDLERKQLETARKMAENARDTEQTLTDQAQQRLNEGAPQAELRELWAKVGDARKRYGQAQDDVEQRIDRLQTLNAELRRLQSDRITTLQEAEVKRREAEEARKKVERLVSPLAPQNLLRWVLVRGPRVLGILLVMVAVLWLARRFENQIVKLMIGRAAHGSPVDRENRARTLVGVAHSAVAVAVIAAGSLMMLTEVGVDIIPLMGGAAVVGLAVAFGAQNLIRDYFYGFMILLESQYTVNDVVKVGDVSGQVERITLRITVLRGLDGTVHFVPNGEITRVSNMTHGWSRALFDIPIAYKEDVDRVMELLVELAKELRRDPDYRGLILEMPEMLGVDEFRDSAVVIKFFIKTRPLQQWTVKRELLRRIKKRFDELGIEIPLPQRMLYHRSGNDAPPLAAGVEISAASDRNDRRH